jgi:hypothetical protein
LARDPELVRWDVIEQYVSRAAAHDDYGVVLKDDLALDCAATDALRQKLRESHQADSRGTPQAITDSAGNTVLHTDLTVFATGIN